jgi:hypothetical protein
VTDRLPVSAIKEQLVARIRELVDQLCPGGRWHGGYWQGPNPTRVKDGKTSFTIWRNGAWKEFDDKEKGDVIDLIAYCRRSTVGEAITWAKDWLGLTGMAPARRLSAEAEARRKARDEEEARRIADRQRRGAEIWQRATPLARDGLVDIYLKGRRIDLAALVNSERDLRQAVDLFYWGPWPEGERGSWRGPAMVAPIRQLSGEVSGAHATFLTRDGTAKAPLLAAKIMLGTKKHGAVRLTRGKAGLPFRDLTPDTAEDLVIGEGIETMLSVALALPEERVWAALDLGNIGELPFDPRIRRLTAKGFDVVPFAPPWGDDFNDTLR